MVGFPDCRKKYFENWNQHLNPTFWQCDHDDSGESKGCDCDLVYVQLNVLHMARS